MTGYLQVNNIEAKSGDMVAVRDTFRTTVTAGIGSATRTIDSTLSVFLPGHATEYGGIRARGGLFSGGLSALSLSLTNPLTTANGGTGLSSWTAGDLSYYASGTALSKLAIGANKTVLQSNGTAPVWNTNLDVGTGTISSANHTISKNSSGAAGSFPLLTLQDDYTAATVPATGILLRRASATQLDWSVENWQGVVHFRWGLDLTDIGIGTSVLSIATNQVTIAQPLDATIADFSGLVQLSGTTANIALGSNFLSGDGGDEGLSISSTGVGTFSSDLNITGTTNLSSLTASRLVATDASKNLVSTITAGNLLSSVTGTTGTAGNLMFSVSPTTTGTFDAEAIDASGGLVLSGTASNVTLGSNFISNGGTDAGFSLDASNNATFTDAGTFGGNVTVGSGTLKGFGRELYVGGASSVGLVLENSAAGAGNSTLRWAQNGTDKWQVQYDNSSNALLFYDFTGTPGVRVTINNGGNIDMTGSLSVTGAGTFGGQLLLGSSSPSSDIFAINKTNADEFQTFWNNSVFKGGLGFIYTAGNLINGSASGDFGIRSEGALKLASGGATATLTLDASNNAIFTGAVSPGGTTTQGGVGVPAVNDTISWTGQTVTIAAQNFANTTTGKLYEVTYYVHTTTTGTGTVTFNLAWNDGTAKTFTSATAALTATDNTGMVTGVQVIFVSSGTPTWSTTVAGGGSTEQYAVRVALKRLW